jgi:lipoprotein signal peptidase
MEKTNRLELNRRDLAFAVIALLVIIADQLSKLWISGTLQPGETLFDIGFFRIVYVLNSGAAFGIFKNAPLFLSSLIHRHRGHSLPRLWAAPPVAVH